MRGRLASLGAALRGRPTLAAALVYALLTFAFVAPAVVTGRVLSNSDSFYFKPPWDAVRPAKLHRPANPEFDDAPAQIQLRGRQPRTCGCLCRPPVQVAVGDAFRPFPPPVRRC